MQHPQTEPSSDRLLSVRQSCERLGVSYSAFTAERHPEGIKIITGTGLIAPTF